jgi:hypothetical protein
MVIAAAVTLRRFRLLTLLLAPVRVLASTVSAAAQRNVTAMGMARRRRFLIRAAAAGGCPAR